MNHFLLVALGGAVGACLRHFSAILLLRILGPGFPYGTLFVNIAGSFAMGLFIGWMLSQQTVSNEIRLFVATGILGGFTTFSAFSLDVANMIERDAMSMAAIYICSSVIASIVILFAGLWLSRNFL